MSTATLSPTTSLTSPLLRTMNETPGNARLSIDGGVRRLNHKVNRSPVSGGKAGNHTKSSWVSARPLFRKSKYITRPAIKVNASWIADAKMGFSSCSNGIFHFDLNPLNTQSQQKNHHMPVSSKSVGSHIASKSLKKLLLGDLRRKALSSAVRSRSSRRSSSSTKRDERMKVDGIQKELRRVESPQSIASNDLEKAQGEQRGLVLQVGGQSMHLLGQLQDQVEDISRSLEKNQSASAELSEPTLQDVGGSNEDKPQIYSVLPANLSASGRRIDKYAVVDRRSSLSNQEEDNGAATTPMPATTSSLRRRHVRNNSCSAPSLLAGNLFEGMMGDRTARSGNKNVITGVLDSDNFDFCALNGI